MINLSISSWRSQTPAGCSHLHGRWQHLLHSLAEELPEHREELGQIRSVCWGASFPAISPRGQKNLLYFGREGGMLRHYETLKEKKNPNQKNPRSTLQSSLNCNWEKNEFEIPRVTPVKISHIHLPNNSDYWPRELEDFFVVLLLSNLFLKSPSWKLYISGWNKKSVCLFGISAIVPCFWGNYNIWFCF